MFTNSPDDRVYLGRLERAVAATPKELVAEGRAQNELSTVHWLIENAGEEYEGKKIIRFYKLSILRNGVIAAQKTISSKEVPDNESAATLVKAMFAKLPSKAN